MTTSNPFVAIAIGTFGGALGSVAICAFLCFVSVKLVPLSRRFGSDFFFWARRGSLEFVDFFVDVRHDLYCPHQRINPDTEICPDCGMTKEEIYILRKGV